jgi:hypothetical protein
MALGVLGVRADQGAAATNGLRLVLVEKTEAFAKAPVGAEPSKSLHLRWENVGREKLLLERDRCCDLYSHVFLQAPDGTISRAKQCPPKAAHAGKALVTIEAGKAEEEVLDLWQYVEKPAQRGKYQLWVEFLDHETRLDEYHQRHPEFARERKASRPGLWAGKAISNRVEVEVK